MILEAVEASGPKLSVACQPVVQLLEWFGTNAVETSLSVAARLDNASLLQDSEVLRYSGLTQPQRCHQFAHRTFPISEQVHDGLTIGLAESMERGRCRHAKVF